MSTRNRFLIITFGFLFIMGAVFLFRQQMPIPEQGKKMQIAASFYPLYFFTAQIAGERADVFNVTPAGAEPHEYEPTAQDIARIENSNLLILNGGNLEAWGPAVRQNLDPQRTSVVVAGEGLAVRQMQENGNIIIDPHIWLSPALAQKMADKIADGLIRIDPADADQYLVNAGSLKAKLADLDSAYKKGLAACAQKDIVTAHAAFGYLAAAYGFNQISIAGLSPDAEPSPQQLADIARFAKTRGVRYIFFESLVSPKLSETIAREVGAQTLALNPLEGLSAGESAQGKDYFSEMRNNLSNLQIALQCQK